MHLSRIVAGVALGVCAALGTASKCVAQDAVLTQLYGEGVHAYFADRPADAHRYLTKAVDAGTQDPRVFYFRALAYLQLGREVEAENDFQRGAELEMADVNKFYPVARSLERVQGASRVAVERHRTEAQLTAFQRAEEVRQERFGGGSSEGTTTTRPPAPAPPRPADLPGLGGGPSAPEPEVPAAPGGGQPADPFAEDNDGGEVDPFAPPKGGREPLVEEDPFAPAQSPPQGGNKSAPADGGDEADPFGAAGGGDEADPFGAPAEEAAPEAEPAGEADPFGAGGGEADPFGAPAEEAAPEAEPAGEADPFGAGGGEADPFGAPAEEAAPEAEPAGEADPFGAGGGAGAAPKAAGGGGAPGHEHPSDVGDAVLQGLGKALLGGGEKGEKGAGAVEPVNPMPPDEEPAQEKATGDPFGDDQEGGEEADPFGKEAAELPDPFGG